MNKLLILPGDELDILCDIMDEFVYGTNIEIYGVSQYKEDNNDGLEFDLFDCDNKITDFESDVASLLDELDKELETKWICSHEYSDETSISDLDGEEYPDYHCYVRIYQKVE